MMTSAVRTLTAVALTLIALVGLGLVYAIATGLSARAAPSRLEATLARGVRRLAIPRAARRLSNPVPATAEHLADGRAHFADHCASCHGNDGSGNTELGRNLFPPAPDMRLPATQQLGDGELFHVIENGVRFTGMPGWGDGSDASRDATWRLVQFVRHLPSLTEEEIRQMEALNPRPPDEIRREMEEERFLSGEGADAPVKMKPDHQGAH